MASGGGGGHTDIVLAGWPSTNTVDSSAGRRTIKNVIYSQCS